MKHEKYILKIYIFFIIILYSQIFIIRSKFSKINSIEWVMFIPKFLSFSPSKYNIYDEIYIERSLASLGYHSLCSCVRFRILTKISIFKSKKNLIQNQPYPNPKKINGIVYEAFLTWGMLKIILINIFENLNCLLPALVLQLSRR